MIKPDEIREDLRRFLSANPSFRSGPRHLSILRVDPTGLGGICRYEVVTVDEDVDGEFVVNLEEARFEWASRKGRMLFRILARRPTHRLTDLG